MHKLIFIIIIINMFLFIIIYVFNIHMSPKNNKKRRKNQISNPAISNGGNEKKFKKKESQTCRTCHAQTCVREGAHSRRFKWRE